MLVYLVFLLRLYGIGRFRAESPGSWRQMVSAHSQRLAMDAAFADTSSSSMGSDSNNAEASVEALLRDYPRIERNYARILTATAVYAPSGDNADDDAKLINDLEDRLGAVLYAHEIQRVVANARVAPRKKRQQAREKAEEEEMNHNQGTIITY